MGHTPGSYAKRGQTLMAPETVGLCSQGPLAATPGPRRPMCFPAPGLRRSEADRVWCWVEAPAPAVGITVLQLPVMLGRAQPGCCLGRVSAHVTAWEADLQDSEPVCLGCVTWGPAQPAPRGPAAPLHPPPCSSPPALHPWGGQLCSARRDHWMGMCLEHKPPGLMASPRTQAHVVLTV